VPSCATGHPSRPCRADVQLPTGSRSDLGDEVVERPVSASDVVYHGLVWDVRRDSVDLGDAGPVMREYVEHPGAVVVVALKDVGGLDHVVLIRQYRHPVRTTEWELPAGLLDVAGEPPWEAAARELLEEVDLVAARWHVLLDFYSSPGGLSEVMRVFVARDVKEVSATQRFSREGEEAEIRGLWVSLDDAYAAVLAGEVHNPGAVVGILAAWGAKQSDWTTLRPKDEPWTWHPAYRSAVQKPGPATDA